MCGFIHIVSLEFSTHCGRVPNTGGNFRRLEPVVAVTVHWLISAFWSSSVIQVEVLKQLFHFQEAGKFMGHISEHMGCLLGFFPNEINLSWALQPFFSIGEQSLKWVLALFSVKSNGHPIRFGNRYIDCGNLVPNADYFDSPINHFSSFTFLFNIQNSL